MTASPPQLALRLSTPELWILHHVLLDRIELEHRSPSTAGPPPIEVFRAFEKLETGDHLFTRSELQHMHGELEQYLERSSGASTRERAAIEEIIDRITDVLASRRQFRSPFNPDRRPRP